MRDIYRMVEQMLITEEISIEKVISVLSDRLLVEDALHKTYSRGYICEIVDGYRDRVGIIYYRNDQIMVTSVQLRFRGSEGTMVEIGDKIKIYVATEEHFYRFLVRNDILRQDNKVILERLVLEYV